MTYMLNFWQTSQAPVGCALRTDDFDFFKKKCKELFKRRHITHYRVIQNHNSLAVSAPIDSQSIPTWRDATFTRSPISVEYFNFKYDQKIHLERKIK